MAWLIDQEKHTMKMVAKDIPAYDYGKAVVVTSPVLISDLESLKMSVGFTDQGEQFLRLAGEGISRYAL